MIEVDYKTIPAFLISRKRLNEEWSKKYKALKLKQQEMNVQMNFLECEQELEKLKEGSTKTFFGGYSSKEVNQLQNLIKMFKKENLHIVDLGKALVQQWMYDMQIQLIEYARPGLKKQRTIIDQQIIATEQRILDLRQQATNNETNYLKHCEKLGIQGINIEEEVPQMILQLPSLFQKIEEITYQNQILLDAIVYYRQFVNYQHNSDIQFVIHLENFIEKGNTKLLPQSIKSEQQSSQDWEIIGNQNEPVEIDWQKYAQPQQITLDDCDLLKKEFRNQLLLDLTELQIFYENRIQITQQDQKNAIFDVYLHQNTNVFDIPLRNLEKFKFHIDETLNLLQGQKLNQLLILKDSERQQGRIIQNLQDLKNQQKKNEANTISSQQRLNDLFDEKQKVTDEVQKLEKETQQLKEYCEKQLSELFKHEIKINL